MNATDLLHQTLMQDPDYDPAQHATSEIKSALLSLASALAYLDGNPDRISYVESLIDLHRGDDDLLTAAVVTAGSWLQDMRTISVPA